jgi:hypothetical protein
MRRAFVKQRLLKAPIEAAHCATTKPAASFEILIEINFVSAVI